MSPGRWFPRSPRLPMAIPVLGGKDRTDLPCDFPVWTGTLLMSSPPRRARSPTIRATSWLRTPTIFYAGNSGRPLIHPLGTGAGAGRRPPVRHAGLRSSRDVICRGKILYVGAGGPQATAETIDLNVATPVWRGTGSMAYPRRHLTPRFSGRRGAGDRRGSGGRLQRDHMRAVAEILSRHAS